MSTELNIFLYIISFILNFLIIRYFQKVDEEYGWNYIFARLIFSSVSFITTIMLIIAMYSNERYKPNFFRKLKIPQPPKWL